MKVDALRGERLYLDSNALIYAFEGDPAHQPASVAKLVQAIGGGHLQTWASLLVRAEVLVMPLRQADAPRSAFYRRLFDSPALLRMAPLTNAVADASAALRAQHPSLKLVDAMHLAAALESGCMYFLSADRRLRAAAQGRIETLSYDDLD